MKKGSKFFVLIVVFIVLVLTAGFVYVKNLSQPVVKGEFTQEVRVEIPYGMSVLAVGNELQAKNLIKSSKLFYYTARYPQLNKILFPDENDSHFALKSGIYYIRDNMNVVQIQSLLSSGQQEFVKLSVPEGYTISKIAAELEESGICKAADFISICKNPQFCAGKNIPAETCEGYLFPDTYFLTAGMSAGSVAELMIDNFYEKIKTIPNLSEMNPEDLFYTVKLASIVEREYRLAEEAPLIASVFKNRLKHNIGLYSCATVEYILTEIEGRPHPERILIEDTKIDNPYNTYKWAGLPPGPISNPGIVALDASVNTPKTNYYYFQVADVSAGRHVFTNSFDEHIDNHSLYTKKASGK